MVGDIAETTQSPVCGSLRLAFWISLVPGPRVWTRVSKTHRQEGGRGETSRCFAAQSQIPGRWPRRSLSRCPEKRLQGACRSSPGSHAGIKAEGVGRGATMVAGSPVQRDQSARPPACSCLEGSAVTAAATLHGQHQRYRMTSCLALREVVRFPNKSPARLQTSATNQDKLRWWRWQTTFARNHEFPRF